MTDEDANSIFRAQFGLVDSKLLPEQLKFVRAIEAAAIAPLLERIAALTATLAASCADEREQLWEATTGGGCSRALDAEAKVAALEAKLAQRVPDGWKLVSTKADFDQLQAGSAAWHNVSQDDCITDEVRFQRVYAAMFSAAPAAPEQQEQAKNNTTLS